MKIAIAHFRTGLTDGVSLEIEKRQHILEQMGHEVVLIGGTHAGHLDLYIPEFEYKQDETVAVIQKMAFEPERGDELQQLVEPVAKRIEASLEEFLKKEKFEMIFIHNVFCLAVCLPGTLAFYTFLKNHPEIKAITIHHDFYWEPARWDVSNFTNPYAKEILDTAFTPNLPNLTHTVINSLAQKALKEKKGIESEVITDTFDFDQPLWVPSERNKDYLKDLDLNENDIMFLIAVRVRQRKAVELAIDTVAAVNRMKEKLIGKKKYNGHEITADSKVVLLIPGEFTPKEALYVEKLIKRASDENVDVRWISNLVGSEEQQELGEKKYALWDSYIYADAVLYTSHWEGWGNQFIEAVFAKKPIVVFEYPVFTSDIKPDKFIVTSLGDEYITYEDGLIDVSDKKVQEAAVEICDVLTNTDEYNRIIENNFQRGKEKYNVNKRLKEHLSQFFTK